MSIQKLVSEKSENKKNLLKSLSVKGKSRALGLLCGKLEIDEDLIEGLKYCNADFVVLDSDLAQENVHYKDIESISEYMKGFDFYICNGESETIQDMLQLGVTPIMKTDNYLSGLLKEFNPIRGEGNCFFYESENKWSIYASLVKYLENYRFPYDNKNLVKNIVST